MLIRLMIVSVLVFLCAPRAGLSRDRCCQKLRTEMKKLNKLATCGARRECPVGYLHFKNSCYWFRLGHNDLENWWAAQNFCRNHGGNLVTVNDRRRETFIKNHLQANCLNTENPITMYTGLIYTDSKGYYPHMHSPPWNKPVSSEGGEVRWVSTGEYIKWPNKTITLSGNGAKWSPKIQGDHIGPGSTYLSCVALIWDPSAPANLTWKFRSCSASNLSVICEIRLRPQTTGPPQSVRYKRSPATDDTHASFIGNAVQDNRLANHFEGHLDGDDDADDSV